MEQIGVCCIPRPKSSHELKQYLLEQQASLQASAKTRKNNFGCHIAYLENFFLVENESEDISSTLIRERIMKKEPISDLTDKKVEAYLKKLHAF